MFYLPCMCLHVCVCTYITFIYYIAQNLHYNTLYNAANSVTGCESTSFPVRLLIRIGFSMFTSKSRLFEPVRWRTTHHSLLSGDQLSIYIFWVIIQSRESPCKLCLCLTLPHSKCLSLIRCLSDKLQRSTIIILSLRKGERV